MEPTEKSERPDVMLQKGALILKPKLSAYGFSFKVIDQGRGSGGSFAIGRFRNGDRQIELWFRYQLGSVTYKKGKIKKSHADYMQALGREREAAYPGYGWGDNLKGFHHLLSDLQYCEAFLAENGEGFVSLMKNFTYQHPKPLWRN